MKWFKRALIVIGLIFLIISGGILILDEEIPKGVASEEAEALADKMMEAIGHEMWMNTGAVKWSFGGRHDLIWDRKRHLAQVTWNQNTIQVDIDRRRGVIIESENEDRSKLCLKAWEIWANDSFWLNPVSKIRDPGTERRVVDYDGRRGLLVTYLEGGVTPGDSYLWFTDEQGLPYEWKMWVGILPIGGIKASWEQWERTETGVMISMLHKHLISLKLENVRTAKDIETLMGEDIFEGFMNNESDFVSF